MQQYQDDIKLDDRKFARKFTLEMEDILGPLVVETKGELDLEKERKLTEDQ